MRERPDAISVAAVGQGLQLSSGRVIAIGRLLLASLFLLAFWLDPSQPVRAPDAGLVLLFGYVAFAALIVIATWRNWWLDARLAGPAHAADIAMFTLLVLATEGYASPFFPFFIFLLLSAAIRWSWLSTALTAMLLTVLYFSIVLMIIEADQGFDLQQFLVRSGHLVILSLILIWFGATQWQSRLQRRMHDVLGQTMLDEMPFRGGLQAVMHAVRAREGAMAWYAGNGGESRFIRISGDVVEEPAKLPAGPQQALPTTSLLYDLKRDHALHRDRSRNLVRSRAADRLSPALVSAFGLVEGLAVPVQTDEGTGVIFLEKVRGLSTDHLDLGEQVAAEVAAHIQRNALLRAAEENAGARARLSLARDLHDSVVQFLAGAAFRLEAMKRAHGAGPLEDELNELKQLMLHEQKELRVFITAMRGGATVTHADLVADLKALAERLSRQWGTRCTIAAGKSDAAVPTRLYLDIHQIVREAVANAVRHAGAKTVEIVLSATADEVALTIVNDGKALPVRDGRLEVPVSLDERIAQAGGKLDISRGMDVTKLAITLPIDGSRR